jgi:hypothetical protein
MSLINIVLYGLCYYKLHYRVNSNFFILLERPFMTPAVLPGKYDCILSVLSNKNKIQMLLRFL